VQQENKNQEPSCSVLFFISHRNRNMKRVFLLALVVLALLAVAHCTSVGDDDNKLVHQKGGKRKQQKSSVRRTTDKDLEKVESPKELASEVNPTFKASVDKIQKVDDDSNVDDSKPEKEEGEITKWDLAQLAASASKVVYEDRNIQSSGFRTFFPMCGGANLQKFTGSQSVTTGLDSFVAEGYISYPKKQRLLMITFRGSESSLDWEANLKGYLKRESPSSIVSAKVPGKTTAGWSKAFASWEKKNYKHVSELLTREENKDAILLVTGHSLGGVMAHLGMARILASKLFNPKKSFLITFGSPAPGNTGLSSFLTTRLQCSNILRFASRHTGKLPPFQDCITKSNPLGAHSCPATTVDNPESNNCLFTHKVYTGYMKPVFADKRFSSGVCNTFPNDYNKKWFDEHKKIAECFKTLEKTGSANQPERFRMVVEVGGKCEANTPKSVMGTLKRAMVGKNYCYTNKGCKKAAKNPCKGYCSCTDNSGLASAGECKCVALASEKSWCERVGTLKATSDFVRFFSAER